MMKNVVIICCLLFGGYGSFCQNLVPNPSFEDTSSASGAALLHKLITCKTSLCTSPTNIYCLNWYDPTKGSPDYFNSWSVVAQLGIPQNTFGSQMAEQGNSYVGIGSWGGPYYPHQREYVAVQLLSPLISGKKYNVAFNVSLSDSSKWAIDNMGMYISTTPANDYTTALNLNYTPQINNHKDSVITNMTDWTLISGTYIASGGEKYITIGNFYPDSLTRIDTLTTGNRSYGAYYYVDNVSVVQDTTYSGDGINELSNSLSFSVFPNPATTNVIIRTSQSNPVQISLRNLLGQIVYDYRPALSSTYSIDVGDLPKAMYVLEMRNMVTGAKGRQKVIVQ